MAAAEESTAPFRARPEAVSSPPRRYTIADVIDAWRAFGPLEHHPTHFRTLDHITGGGPVFGTRWYVMGAPDACKTLFLSMLAQVWDAEGLLVGMMAVDEEPEDLAMRFIQRIQPESWNGAHFQRIHCEDRDEPILQLMTKSTSHIGVVFYGPDWTIESASADLDSAAKIKGKRCAMMFDSVQTVECDAIRKDKKELSLRERITENVRAIRNVATRYKMITVSTSEMNRAAYKTIGKVEQNDMAAAKESGAIEYSARVMLALRVYPDEADTIECRVIKNKHGASFPAIEPFYFRIYRAQQLLADREPPEGVGEMSLEDECMSVLYANPVGMATDAIAKSLGKRKAAVVAAMQTLEASKRVRRIAGGKSPWVSAEVDPDSDEFP